MLQIETIILHRLNMELKHPFTTSFGTVREKDFFIVEAISKDGIRGYGETVAFTSPWYTEETTETIFHMLDRFLIPLLLHAPIRHPDDVTLLLQKVKRNRMAKMALESAIWDIYATMNELPLAQALGGSKRKIAVGISLGMEEKTSDLLHKIEVYAAAQYKRIKIKVAPERDIAVLKEVRRHFPDLPLMVDANSAYTLDDLEHLRKFDEFNLMMLEQPLSADDIIDHAKLQRVLQTPICLDESIHSLDDVKLAVALKSCRIINIKAGRVGGLTEAKRIHDFCMENQIAVWCGGMLDAGVGRAHNIALATLPNFTLPGDIGPSAHYWEEDIIAPEVVVHDGMIDVPQKPGIGFEIDRAALQKFTVNQFVYK